MELDEKMQRMSVSSLLSSLASSNMSAGFPPLHMCISQWKLKAAFVSGKLESNPVITSQRLVRVIKVTSKYSKGVIIYWCMKDTKEKLALFLQRLKNTSENAIKDLQKAVNSPFRWADLVKLLWEQ